MSTRAYDYIITVNDASSFVEGNVVVGLSTNASAEIVQVENNNLKVIMSNVYSEFLEGETISSQSAIMVNTNTFADLSSSIDGQTNTFSVPESSAFTDSVQVYADGFLISKDRYSYSSSGNSITFKNVRVLADASSSVYEEVPFPTTDINKLLIQVVTANTQAGSFVASDLNSYIETATSSIQSIYNAPYIAEKNSTQQTPLVKLYSIYYPGEWYPANSAGNPTKTGEGFPWPHEFPLRYAEVVGESFSDFNYTVSFGGNEYKVISMSSSDISLDLSSTINSITLELSNFDGSIASLIENKNIAGVNSTGSTLAIKNGEIVTNIDPRTVSSNVSYDPSVASTRGVNAAWDYSSTVENGDTWIAFKEDSRDLLGAVTELKMTYSKFLDYWPEYSTVRSSTTNSAIMYSTVPYRVGDTVTSNSSSSTTTISAIKGSNVSFSNTSLGALSTGTKLLIVNPDADKNAYVENIFVINKLNDLSEVTASFELTDWLQNFKSELPKRKFYNTTCPWKYKGAECKYPTSGTTNIVGSNPPISANGFFTYNNESTSDPTRDICSKTLTACRLRNNVVNFGGFPGVKEE